MKHTYKGGRGKKAPWSSKVVRIPEPLWAQVDKLLDDFYAPTPQEVLFKDPSISEKEISLPLFKEPPIPVKPQETGFYNRTKNLLKELKPRLTNPFTGAQKSTKEEN